MSRLDLSESGCIRRMMTYRKAQLHSVYKRKYRMEGCPLGDFDAYMESPHSLPLIIRGQTGRFDSFGTWVPQAQTARLY